MCSSSQVYTTFSKCLWFTQGQLDLEGGGYTIDIVRYVLWLLNLGIKLQVSSTVIVFYSLDPVSEFELSLSKPQTEHQEEEEDEPNHYLRIHWYEHQLDLEKGGGRESDTHNIYMYIAMSCGINSVMYMTTCIVSVLVCHCSKNFVYMEK